MEKRYRKTKLLAVMALLVTTSGMAQKVNELSAKQAVEYGLKNSVQVKNALLDILIQEQTNRELTSGAYPQITPTGTVTDYLNIPTTLLPGEIIGQPPGTYTPVKFGTKYSAVAGVGLS